MGCVGSLLAKFDWNACAWKTFFAIYLSFLKSYVCHLLDMILHGIEFCGSYSHTLLWLGLYFTCKWHWMKASAKWMCFSVSVQSLHSLSFSSPTALQDGDDCPQRVAHRNIGEHLCGVSGLWWWWCHSWN